MAKVRRKAKFLHTLVFMDEPQLVELISGKTTVVAIAIPDNDDAKSMFLAATVHPSDWESYMEGSSDLRYLFTFPKFRSLFTFDLQSIKDDSVMMTPLSGTPSEDYLPHPRFFSDSHTEDHGFIAKAAGTERLLVDGEWDMPEFGVFYQKYSEIYAFLSAVVNYATPAVEDVLKSKIRSAFKSKPFQGGFSYLHFYNDLVDSLTRNERIGLDEIAYASPGHVDISGNDLVFGEIAALVPHYLDNRSVIQTQYDGLYGYLQKNGYLKIPGDQYPLQDPTSGFFKASAEQLANSMGAPDYNTVLELADGNALVAAKIVLSFERRLKEAATFFAQGRVSFS